MKSDAFQKYGNAPVFGNRETGTLFDAYVTRQQSTLRMDLSWRPKSALAVSFSEDGLHWTDPVITLECDPTTGWEDNINRNCVLPDPFGDGYLMWYTGQANDRSWIGVARSEDGMHFTRFQKDPILAPEWDFEGASVMNPFVMYENGVFRMWYAAGETMEPNVLCYAESTDGISWVKYSGNLIMTCAPENEYEQNRIGSCHIVRESDCYTLFYIGYRDIDTACICAARSEDGITNWKRLPENPLITPTPGSWDEHSCYKPTVIREADGLYRLWYNGRRNNEEYIGYATGTLKDER